ncbi:MAG: hypothetical protein FWD48_08750 [Oscillospiraceae bacterium]|nr:hypothetical protein [Oscillospiraceae bacterium]
MNEISYPVLCGGTFFTLILRALKQSDDVFSAPDVLTGLINIIQPEFKKPGEKTFITLTSQFKSCSPKMPKISKHLPFTNRDIITHIETNIPNSYHTYLKATQVFVDKFIDVNSSTKKSVMLTKRLLELIKRDESIKDDDIFYIRQDGTSFTKLELCGLSDICLPALLLGIWHFIIVNRKDNKIGQATYDSWHESHKTTSKTGGAEREFISDIGKNIKNNINFVGIDEPVFASKTIEPNIDDTKMIPVDDSNSTQNDNTCIEVVEKANPPIIEEKNLVVATTNMPAKNVSADPSSSSSSNYLTDFKERLAKVLNENNPTKTYNLYQEMYSSLIYKYTANTDIEHKLKTNLPIDIFLEYLSEFCYIASKDNNYDMCENEFTSYFKKIKFKNGRVNINDFIYDACSNACFMFNDYGRLRFLHRSLQEYLVARHLNKKLSVFYEKKEKKKLCKKLITYFERRCSVGDISLDMLIEMNLPKVEKLIYAPFLENICGGLRGPMLHFNCYCYVTEINSPISELYRYVLRGAGFHGNYDVSVWYDDEEEFSIAYKAMKKYFTDIQNRLY